MSRYHDPQDNFKPYTQCEDCNLREQVQQGMLLSITNPNTKQIIQLNKPKAIIYLRKRCKCKKLGYK